MLLVRLILFSTLVVGVGAHDYSQVIQQLKDKKNVVSVLVIGGGPAGYAAAMQASRFGLDVVLCEGPQPGGQLSEAGEVTNIAGIISARGFDIMQAQRTQVEQHGVTILTETVKTLDCSMWPFHAVTEEGTQLCALSVIVATGSAPRKLGVSGEEQFWGMGVSACALCDGRFFRNKTVAVIGGGDSAVEEVLQLTPYASKIILLVRSNQLRALPVMQEKLSDVEQLTIQYNKQVQAIIGDQKVQALNVCDNQTHQTERIAVDGVFLAVGHAPCVDLVRDYVSLAPEGHVQTIGQSRATATPGLFVAGDVAKSKYRQWGVAAGEGQIAAEDSCDFLQTCGLTVPVLRALRSGKRTIEGLQFYSK